MSGGSYHIKRVPGIAWFFALWLSAGVASNEPLLMEGAGMTLMVDVADTHESRVQGLSGREVLPGGEGLLFDFKRMGKHSIWMKDMRFAIDIVWLDEQGRVVDVKSRARPESFPETFRNVRPARYVLEVGADSGIRTGQAFVCARRGKDRGITRYPSCAQAVKSWRGSRMQ